MSEPTWIIANYAPVPKQCQRLGSHQRLHLATFGQGQTVHLNLDSFTQGLGQNLSELHEDLLEVMAIVYNADLQLCRGLPNQVDYGDRWQRELNFVIPVRLHWLWSRIEVRQCLSRLLGYLTDDVYHFQFVPVGDETPPIQLRNTNGLPLGPDQAFDEVMLFSGGIDSLAGAVEEIMAGQKRVILVSHRSNTITQSRQHRLYQELSQRVASSIYRPAHLSLQLHLQDQESEEATQRSRAFVFACTAAVAAQQNGLTRIRFAENGITSLNLPICLQVLGGRASRTTHPRVLASLSQFFTLLFQTPFTVENRSLWQTKAELLERIVHLGQADLIPLTRSCVRTRIAQENHPHCGRCSQCIDRRLSSIIAGVERAGDPAQGYFDEVLTGARQGAELTLVDRFVSQARRWATQLNPEELLSEFGEFATILPAIPGDAEQNAKRLIDLLARHGRGLQSLLNQLVIQNGQRLYQMNYPANSLLGLVIGRTPSDESNTPVSCELQVDLEKQKITFRGRTCELPRRLEFSLAHYFAKNLSQYVSNDTLAEQVWNDSETTESAIQSAIRRVRSRFHDAGLNAIQLDGKTRPGSYRMILTDGSAS